MQCLEIPNDRHIDQEVVEPHRENEVRLVGLGIGFDEVGFI
jgi:hypothetical protein